jgi:formylglycine-generating enzyme required for sulfatase activity
VGTGRAPNKLNIYDMSGNVQEWVEDWTNVGIVDARVVMGTSFARTLEHTTLRYGYTYKTPAYIPDHPMEWFGFRVARSK